MPPPTDAQTDVQNAPVDDESLMRKLAVVLTQLFMYVPSGGTIVLSGHHFFMYITDMSAFYVLAGQVCS